MSSANSGSQSSGRPWQQSLARNSISARNQARRQETALRRQTLEALDDAARVRLMADTVREHNPGFAADLYAAADRTVAGAGR